MFPTICHLILVNLALLTLTIFFTSSISDLVNFLLYLYLKETCALLYHHLGLLSPKILLENIRHENFLEYHQRILHLF